MKSCFSLSFCADILNGRFEVEACNQLFEPSVLLRFGLLVGQRSILMTSLWSRLIVVAFLTGLLINEKITSRLIYSEDKKYLESWRK